MSRHRLLQRELDDYHDDVYGDEEDEDNEFHDDDEDDGQHVDDESINAVQAVLEGMDVGRDQICAALLANNMSCDAAVNALLQEASSENKQSKHPANKTVKSNAKAPAPGGMVPTLKLSSLSATPTVPALSSLLPGKPSLPAAPSTTPSLTLSSLSSGGIALSSISSLGNQNAIPRMPAINLASLTSLAPAVNLANLTSIAPGAARSPALSLSSITVTPINFSTKVHAEPSTVQTPSVASLKSMTSTVAEHSTPSNGWIQSRPSDFAKSIFDSSDDDDLSDDHGEPVLTFVSDASRFDFKTPSPDDVVFQARQSTGSKQSPQTAKAPNAVKPSQSSDKLSTPGAALPPKMPSQKSQENLGQIKLVKAMSNMSVASSAGASRSSSRNSSQRINVHELWEARQNEKGSVNLVVVGHVDAGKSTLMGHLLFLLGEVDERIMKKYERESQKIGKGSFMYAWVLDESEQERERYSHSSLSFLF